MPIRSCNDLYLSCILKVSFKYKINNNYGMWHPWSVKKNVNYTYYTTFAEASLWHNSSLLHHQCRYRNTLHISTQVIKNDKTSNTHITYTGTCSCRKNKKLVVILHSIRFSLLRLKSQTSYPVKLVPEEWENQTYETLSSFGHKPVVTVYLYTGGSSSDNSLRGVVISFNNIFVLAALWNWFVSL